MSTSTPASGKRKTLSLKFDPKVGKFILPASMLGKIHLQLPVGFEQTGLSLCVVGATSGDTITGVSEKPLHLLPFGDVDRLYGVRRIVNKDEILAARSQHTERVKAACFQAVKSGVELDPHPSFSEELLTAFRYADNLKESMETLQDNRSTDEWNAFTLAFLTDQANRAGKVIDAKILDLLSERRSSIPYEEIAESNQCIWWVFQKLCKQPLVFAGHLPLIQLLFPKDFSKGIALKAKEGPWVTTCELFWRSTPLLALMADEPSRLALLNYQKSADPRLEAREQARISGHQWTMISPINLPDIVKDRYSYQKLHMATSHYADVFVEELIKLLTCTPPLGTGVEYWTTCVHESLSSIPVEDRREAIIAIYSQPDEKCTLNDLRSEKLPSNFWKTVFRCMTKVPSRITSKLTMVGSNRRVGGERNRLDLLPPKMTEELSAKDRVLPEWLALQDGKLFKSLMRKRKTPRALARGMLTKKAKRLIRALGPDDL